MNTGFGRLGGLRRNTIIHWPHCTICSIYSLWCTLHCNLFTQSSTLYTALHCRIALNRYTVQWGGGINPLSLRTQIKTLSESSWNKSHSGPLSLPYKYHQRAISFNCVHCIYNAVLCGVVFKQGEVQMKQQSGSFFLFIRRRRQTDSALVSSGPCWSSVKNSSIRPNAVESPRHL